jgi:hypothetical protein
MAELLYVWLISRLQRGVKMKNVVTLAMAVLIGLSVSGCAVQKNWTATGGSRADGTIKLSYQYSLFEVPKVDNEQGIDLASERCRSWGYGSAEPFGGTVSKCTNFSSSGCNRWLVTAEYQCLDDSNKTASTNVVAVQSELKNSLYEELRQLQELKEKGILTEDEFQVQKTKLLNN